MKKVILTIAVAFVFVFVGSVLASPPVPPPEEGFKIKTDTNIRCTGIVNESQDFSWHWSYNADAALMDIQDGLVDGESVARIVYQEDFYSTEGNDTSFVKNFKAKSHPTDIPNLEVHKVIGYDASESPGASATHDERVALEVVSAGMATDGAAQFAGIMVLCPWATTANGFPATNESIAMGSKFSIGMGGWISSTTDTKAYVTESVELGYTIDALGVGDVTAAMSLSLWEGAVVADTTPGADFIPLAGRTTYTEFAEASGNIYEFKKEMLYQSVFTSPSPIPPDIQQVFNP